MSLWLIQVAESRIKGWTLSIVCLTWWILMNVQQVVMRNPSRQQLKNMIGFWKVDELLNWMTKHFWKLQTVSDHFPWTNKIWNPFFHFKCSTPRWHQMFVCLNPFQHSDVPCLRINSSPNFPTCHTKRDFCQAQHAPPGLGKGFLNNTV